MQYRPLGKTGLRVSEIGFGCWAIGGPATLGDMVIGWGEVDDSASLRALQVALDLGVNFFDTADAYGRGHSEELVGKAFEGKRQNVIIATKVGNRVTPENQWIKDFSPGWIATAIEDAPLVVDEKRIRALCGRAAHDDDHHHRQQQGCSEGHLKGFHRSLRK